MAVRVPVRKVDKPWGYELIWAETESYAGKILHVDVREALSLQLHKVKDETIYVLGGRVRLTMGPSVDRLEVMELGPGEAVRLAPGTVHRIEAIEDTDVLEVSTPHLDDLVRLDDRYGRPAGGT